MKINNLEHYRHVRLNQPDKSAVAFHALEKLIFDFDPKDTSRVTLIKPVNDSHNRMREKVGLLKKVRKNIQ